MGDEIGDKLEGGPHDTISAVVLITFRYTVKPAKPA